MTGSVMSRRRPGDVTEINFRCQFVRIFKEKTQKPRTLFCLRWHSGAISRRDIAERFLTCHLCCFRVRRVGVMPSHQSELTHC